ncbi:unnamed protein product [Trichobilharzia regenti]|nr:unnamed protein product [Trichobilharzia regenti]
MFLLLLCTLMVAVVVVVVVLSLWPTIILGLFSRGRSFFIFVEGML